jgi:hypothetical protein
LEERLSELRQQVSGGLGKVSMRSLLCWAARAIHGIPVSAIARFFGYASTRCVYTVIQRAEHRLGGLSELREMLRFDLF